jgi:hypothetical protein
MREWGSREEEEEDDARPGDEREARDQDPLPGGRPPSKMDMFANNTDLSHRRASISSVGCGAHS